MVASITTTSTIYCINNELYPSGGGSASHSPTINPALDKWKGYKFGLFIHWGIYSQLSDLMPVEASDLASWPMDWGSRQNNNPKITTREQMKKYRDFYFDLNKSFNPKRFDPNIWASAAWEAGMRYVVMTTKHHDGFNMYHTKLDDYGVMGKDCPFKRDAFGETMKAFKKRGFSTGAYYSKADWHRRDFWEPNTFAESRFPNYEPMSNPNLWKSFVNYTQGQVQEIMEQYAPDILWFDGGWIRPPQSDLGMANISHHAKQVKKDVIVVNRAGAYFEDYLTPEQGGIPFATFEKPWEVCMTMATQWGYKRDDVYKSMPELIHLLLSAISNGGNLLLDVGPDPDGQLPREALDRLKEFSKWMKFNDQGIHDTVPIYPYHFISTVNEQTNQVFFLTRRDRQVYAFMIIKEGEKLPKQVYMPFVTERLIGDLPFRLNKVYILPLEQQQQALSFHFKEYLIINLPDKLDIPYQYTLTFKLSE